MGYEGLIGETITMHGHNGDPLEAYMARPIGLKILRPDQPNRAFDLLQPKIALAGLKRFP